MSSLRNSLHRRNHKERSQLAHRARFGLLEKHKDYVLRARDYHSKQDRLQRLQQKAADRNKDEFYFGMARQQTKGGVHVQERGNVALPVDIVKVLKSQDGNYIRTIRMAGLKKIDKLKAQLSALADLLHPATSDSTDIDAGLDKEDLEILHEAGLIQWPSIKGKGKEKHLIFAETREEARSHSTQSKKRKLDYETQTPEAADIDLGWKAPEAPRSKKRECAKSSYASQQEDEMIAASNNEEAKEHRTRLLKELSARLSRDKQLRYAERELEMQKLLMGKGTTQKLRGVEKVDGDGTDGDEEDDGPQRKKDPVDMKLYKPRVYKWKKERRR